MWSHEIFLQERMTSLGSYADSLLLKSGSAFIPVRAKSWNKIRLTVLTVAIVRLEVEDKLAHFVYCLRRRSSAREGGERERERR